MGRNSYEFTTGKVTITLNSLPETPKDQGTITKTRLFKYIENFTSQNWKCSDEKLWYFPYLCSKHRLWVLVRTASARRFVRVPTTYVFEQNKKNNVYPCKPQFYCIKVGFKGVKIIQACFRDDEQWPNTPACEQRRIARSPGRKTTLTEVSFKSVNMLRKNCNRRQFEIVFSLRDENLK